MRRAAQPILAGSMRRAPSRTRRSGSGGAAAQAGGRAGGDRGERRVLLCLGAPLGALLGVRLLPERRLSCRSVSPVARGRSSSKPSPATLYSTR